MKKNLFSIALIGAAPLFTSTPAAADAASDAMAILCSSGAGTCGTAARAAGGVNIIPDPSDVLGPLIYRAYDQIKFNSFKLHNGASDEVYVLSISRATGITSNTETGACAQHETSTFSVAMPAGL